MLAVVKVEFWTPRNENIVCILRYVHTLVAEVVHTQLLLAGYLFCISSILECSHTLSTL